MKPSDGISVGAVAGIVVGIILVLALIAGGVLLFRKRKQSPIPDVGSPSIEAAGDV